MTNIISACPCALEQPMPRANNRSAIGHSALPRRSALSHPFPALRSSSLFPPSAPPQLHASRASQKSWQSSTFWHPSPANQTIRTLLASPPWHSSRKPRHPSPSFPPLNPNPASLQTIPTSSPSTLRPSPRAPSTQRAVGMNQPENRPHPPAKGSENNRKPAKDWSRQLLAFHSGRMGQSALPFFAIAW
jgi:hypothetical protein